MLVIQFLHIYSMNAVSLDIQSASGPNANTYPSKRSESSIFPISKFEFQVRNGRNQFSPIVLSSNANDIPDMIHSYKQVTSSNPFYVFWWKEKSAKKPTKLEAILEWKNRYIQIVCLYI